jgi:hypothetical protein
MRNGWLLIVGVVAGIAAAQDSAPKEFGGQDARRVAAWLEVSRRHAAEYELAPAARPDAKLEMLPKAVFRHSQPVRGDDIGAVYLWVDNAGVPAGLGTVFAYSYGGPGERWVAHEFHSLTTESLSGKWRGDGAWSPSEPAVEWKTVPKAPTPGKSAAERLRQMRSVGRRFAAHSTDASDGRWELRLISQPIYQYGEDKPDEAAGGVFLFCQGTDPEVILQLSVREHGGKSAWYYCLAPFTDYGLNVSLDGTEVWSLMKGHRSSRTGPHWWSGKMEVKKLSPEEEEELAKAFMER